MAEIEGPVVKFKQRMPFTDEEIEKVMWATEVYSIKGICNGVENRGVFGAFVRLLLYSGLRIHDAVTLDVSRFQSKEKPLIPTHKTGQPVVLPLPPDVAKEIWALRKTRIVRSSSWSGNGGVKAAVGGWQRTLLKLFTLDGCGWIRAQVSYHDGRATAYEGCPSGSGRGDFRKQCEGVRKALRSVGKGEAGRSRKSCKSDVVSEGSRILNFGRPSGYPTFYLHCG